MRVRTRQGYHRALLHVVEAAIRAPADPLILAEIAGEAGFSVDHLNRFFRETMGESIGAFLRRIRLERSAHMLAIQGVSVAEASELAGFARPEAFAKAFRAAYSIPPRQFFKTTRSYHLECPTRVHWGETGLREPLIDGVGDWEVRLGFLEPLEVRGLRHVGDFVEIPSAWEALAKRLPERIVRDPGLTWFSVFHSDGMRVDRRDRMEAHLGYLDQPGAPLLAGFEPLTLPGGAYAMTSRLVGPLAHRDAWWLFNRMWVPKSRYRDEQPGYDLYERFPSPWADLCARIHLRLE